MDRRLKCKVIFGRTLSMAKIVDFQTYKTKKAELNAFGPWQNRFGESYNRNTMFSDLSQQVIYRLALPGEDSITAFYELIMGILGLGEASHFFCLDKKNQMTVVDIHLFIADQVRFEMMFRLGWIEKLPCENYSIIEIVTDFDMVITECRGMIPGLSKSHPDYSDYAGLVSMDKEAFIRRMLPKALEIFRKTIRL